MFVSQNRAQFGPDKVAIAKDFCEKLGQSNYYDAAGVLSGYITYVRKTAAQLGYEPSYADQQVIGLTKEIYEQEKQRGLLGEGVHLSPITERVCTRTFDDGFGEPKCLEFGTTYTGKTDVEFKHYTPDKARVVSQVESATIDQLPQRIRKVANQYNITVRNP